MEDEQKPISEKQLATLQELAQNLQYGAIALYFQDGKLIQIERDEKIRIKA